MKKTISIASIIALGVFLIGCNGQTNQAENDENNVEQVKINEMDLNKTKAELKEKFNIAIANIDKEIDVLKAKVESSSEKGKAEWQDALDELNNERKELEQKLSELETTTEDKWEDWNNAAERLLDKAKNKTDSIKENIQETVGTM